MNWLCLTTALNDFSDLRLFLVFLGQKCFHALSTACPHWWSNTVLSFWESSSPKHDTKDVQWNALPELLHAKISTLFGNGATMCYAITGWSMADNQSSEYVSSEKYQISDCPYATSSVVSCDQFSPGEQD